MAGGIYNMVVSGGDNSHLGCELLGQIHNSNRQNPEGREGKLRRAGSWALGHPPAGSRTVLASLTCRC